MMRLRDIGYFLLLLPLLLVALLYTDLGCMLVKFQLEKEFSDRCKHRIQIGKFDFDFPNGFQLSDVLIDIGEKKNISIGKIDVATPLVALLCGNATQAQVNFRDIQILEDAVLFALKSSFHFDVKSQQWNGSISCAESLEWLFSNYNLAGKASLNLNLQGPWDNPMINGIAAIHDGSFERFDSGTRFQHITAELVIDSEKIELRSFTAKNTDRGLLTARGFLRFDPDWNLPFQLNLQLDQASVFHSEEIQGRISGNALFAGNRLGAQLTGDLHLDEVDLYLKRDRGRTSHQLDVTYINQPFQEQPPTFSPKTAIDWPIQLDLHLKSSDSILISNDQLNSEWKADLNLSGTADAPLLYGDCRLVKGDYLFIGKKIQLTQGTISFTGDPRKRTQLYVVGEQEVASIAVEVILKGPLDDLALAFRSTPPFSDKEILCRLLFGRGTAEITPFQGAELTESINKLSKSGGGGPDFLENIKKSFGIDRIDISHGGENGNEEISLQIGKYLTPGVFIGVTKGITTDANRLGIEADLKKNVKIQAEIGDNAEGQLHLKWKHDY